MYKLCEILLPYTRHTHKKLNLFRKGKYDNENFFLFKQRNYQSFIRMIFFRF